MAVSIVHNHVSAIPNDPTKDVSSDRWNEAHSVTGLGTAAEADTGDFATAAQGALADTAVQPADLATVATTGAYSDLTGAPAALIFVCTTTAYGLADVNTAQNLFPAANDTLTVEANTTYFFKAKIRLTNGTNTHTDAFGFGGTATFTSVGYDSMVTNHAVGNINTTIHRVWVATEAMTVLNSTGGQAGRTAYIEGVIRIANAGTIIPQWQFSAAPGGTNQVEPNSFIQFQKVGTDTVASAGAWA